ncbi:glycoside hydrolase family 30 beta sandwich domain-containing protein [Fulvivirga sp. M361]|uniref:glycoside hydrolase family 30 protein n=1 Tax=Fulvivirga sp. M361 TaxID=2594266 RepID=UPI00162976DB|nr:glycoside hydrolase family 30 beta sandwich domain-containing protein [Fulvivirga sp. M361]
MEYIIGLILSLTSMSGCEDNEEAGTKKATDGEVEVHITSLDGSSLLRQLPTKLNFSKEALSGTLVEISETEQGPAIDGFGAALTGSSAYLMHNNEAAIKDLFSEEGISLSYLRLTMGASDFNKNGSYSYNDINEAEDLSLSQFSIAEDKASDNPMIPVAQAILAANSEVSIMASPWTPPPWMKSSKSYIGGSLLKAYYGVYADYFIKYLQAYAAEGIPVGAITVQNEPLHEPKTYPGMKMSALEQADFIGNHLGPKLEAANLSTDIIAYDHNFYVEEDPDYPITVLQDTKAGIYAKGVAYHAYGGAASDIDLLLTQFPDAEIHFTEQSGIIGEQTSFKGEIVWFMENVFAPMLRRGAKSILLWNLALDENNGPKNNGCQTCRGVITITSTKNIVKNPEYYLLGHFSRFVKPGAMRLKTADFKGQFENIAFENSDGSKVLVLLNTSNADDKQIQVNIGSGSFGYTLPANSLVTLRWDTTL